MDDLVVRWVVGRRTHTADEQGREVIHPEISMGQDSIDGVLRQARKTMLEDDVVAITIQIGEYDLVDHRVRDQLHQGNS